MGWIKVAQVNFMPGISFVSDLGLVVELATETFTYRSFKMQFHKF